MPRKTRTNSEEKKNATLRPFWSGTITFGLVSVPVDLYPANRSDGGSLRMLGPNGMPLARRYYSPETGRDLDDDQMVRGYPVSKKKYVVVTDEELERLAPEKTRDIDLRRFVEKDKIPPIYFERGYFLTPGRDTQKAYRLLAETMEDLGRVGIGSFVMRGTEYLVAILSENGILRAETLRFADELRSPADVGLPKRKKASNAALKRFESLIKKKTKDRLSPGEMKDKETERLL
ncbi:MAG: Ku protein, partial [Blastocatellia bacterium]